jgi:flagellar FliL protein
MAASPAPTAPPAKSRRLLLPAIGIAIALVALAAGAGAAWHFTRTDAAAGKGADAKAAEGKPAGGKPARARDGKPPVFVPLDTFTVNLQGNGRENYLQLGVVLEVADGPAADRVKQLMPVIRGQVLLLLAGRTAEDLSRPEGKDTLAADILARVRQPSAAAPALAGIDAVHYAAFIIQ